MKKFKKGFTLVELVIVIAVIAILAAILIPTFSGILERARESSRVQKATQARDEFISANDEVLPSEIEGYIISVDGVYYQIGANGSIEKATIEDVATLTEVTPSSITIEGVKIYTPVDENETPVPPAPEPLTEEEQIMLLMTVPGVVIDDGEGYVFISCEDEDIDDYLIRDSEEETSLDGTSLSHTIVGIRMPNDITKIKSEALTTCINSLEVLVLKESFWIYSYYDEDMYEDLINAYMTGPSINVIDFIKEKNLGNGTETVFLVTTNATIINGNPWGNYVATYADNAEYGIRSVNTVLTITLAPEDWGGDIEEDCMPFQDYILALICPDSALTITSNFYSRMGAACYYGNYLKYVILNNVTTIQANAMKNGNSLEAVIASNGTWEYNDGTETHQLVITEENNNIVEYLLLGYSFQKIS